MTSAVKNSPIANAAPDDNGAFDDHRARPAAVWFHLWEPFHRVSVIGLAATLIGGYPIFKEAFENVVERCECYEDDTENLDDFKAVFMVVAMIVFSRYFAAGCTCGIGMDMGFAGDFSGGVLFA
jgi:hypothetical protein